MEQKGYQRIELMPLLVLIRDHNGDSTVYVYVEDNAVNQVDPTGRTPLMAVGALAGGIINAAVTAYQSKKETGHISISKTAVSFVEGAIAGATLVFFAS